MIKSITSLTNVAIKKVVTLHSPKGRAQHQEFIVEGFRALSAFAQGGWIPTEIYCLESKIHEVQELFKKAVLTVVPAHVLEKLSTTNAPCGVVAVFAIKPTPAVEKLTAGIVLAQIQDPGNAGTLIRSAVAFGYKSVVVIEGCDPYSPKVVQATAGTLAHIRIFQWTWQQLLDNKNNLKLCALVLDGEQNPSVSHTDTLFVVGNEAHGLPGSWITASDTTMTIPLSTGAESLNAAVAGSIALYRGIAQ